MIQDRPSMSPARVTDRRGGNSHRVPLRRAAKLMNTSDEGPVFAGDSSIRPRTTSPRPGARSRSTSHFTPCWAEQWWGTTGTNEHS